MPPFELTPATQSVAGTQFIKTRGIPVGEVGTDPAYSLSLTTRYIRTGALSDTLFDRRPVVPALDYFLRTVAASLRSAFADLGVGHEDQIKLSGYRYTPGTPPAPWPRSPESGHWLKAGPLLGVWATGPFLHNGSVPNVDELLLPPGKRSTVFWVGSRELNVDKLGYRSTRQELSDAERAGLFLFDTTAPGNGNYGHAYPKSPYTDKERMAVIEYLKDPELVRMPKDRR